MKQLIKDCTFGKIDPDACPLFDAEYIFLQIRSKSVGESITLNITLFFGDVNLKLFACF